MWSGVTLMISSPLSEALARKRAWPHITPSDRKYLSNRREYEPKVSSPIVRMMTSLLHHPSCTINSIPISRTVPTAKPPPVVSMCIIHVAGIFQPKSGWAPTCDDPLPNNTSREGTPLDTSSCALCSEGLVPSGWDGLLLTRFLKLVDIALANYGPGYSHSTWISDN